MKQIYYHAQVYTGEDSLAQAFLTEDGLFRAVGTDEEILSLADDGTGLHDMDGAFISPGFNDSHMHLLNYGQTLRMAQLHEHTGSLKDMLSYVREFARENPPKEDGWVTEGKLPVDKDESDGAEHAALFRRSVVLIFRRFCRALLRREFKITDALLHKDRRFFQQEERNKPDDDGNDDGDQIDRTPAAGIVFVKEGPGHDADEGNADQQRRYG